MSEDVKTPLEQLDALTVKSEGQTDGVTAGFVQVEGSEDLSGGSVTVNSSSFILSGDTHVPDDMYIHVGDDVEPPTAKEWLAGVKELVDSGADIAPEISKNLSTHLKSYDTLLEILDRSPEDVTRLMGLLGQLAGVQPAPAPVPWQQVTPQQPTAPVNADDRMVTCEQMIEPHPTSTCAVQGGHSGSVAVDPAMLAEGPPPPPGALTPQQFAGFNTPPIAVGGPPTALGSNGPPSPAVGSWMANTGMNPNDTAKFDPPDIKSGGARRVANYGDKAPGGGSPQQLVRTVG